MKVIALHGNDTLKSYERLAKFIQEAKKRIDEIDRKLVKPYLNNVIDALNTSFSKTDKKHLAEDVLMYGQIFQNYAITFEK